MRGGSLLTASAVSIALVLGGCSATSPSTSQPTIAPTSAPTSSPQPALTTGPSPTMTPQGSTSSSAPVDWSKVDIPKGSTAGGADLARGIDGGTEYLHVVVSNVEDAWQTSQGPSDASAYLRSSDGGQTWSRSRLLGGGAPQVAADGHHVYLAYLAYQCGNGIGVQRNDNNGADGSWSQITCLTRTGTGGSETAPSMTAGTDAVYVVAPRDASHINVWTSRDHGRTWTRSAIGGRAKQSDDNLWWNTIEVAASREFAATAWSDGRGNVLARTSTDAGRHWSSAERIGPGDVVSSAGSDTRLAFGGFGPAGSWVALWKAGHGWTSIPAPEAAPFEPMDLGYGGIVALRPDRDVGLLYDQCRWNGEGYDGNQRWATSTDNGATWGDIEQIARCGDLLPLTWTPDGRVLALGYGDEGYRLSIGP